MTHGKIDVAKRVLEIFKMSDPLHGVINLTFTIRKTIKKPNRQSEFETFLTGVAEVNWHATSRVL